MPKTRLISPGSIPNHRLLKNLQLQGNYISNDGGDEGLSIDNDGIVTASSQIDIGNMSLTTSELDLSSGSLTIDVDEDIILDIGATDELLIKEDGSTFAKIFESSGGNLRLYESAGGTDSFSIITGAHGATTIGTTDVAGNEADITIAADGYLQFTTRGYSGAVGAGEDLLIQPGGKIHIDKNWSHTTAYGLTALHVDVDRTGDVTTGTDTAIGIDLDVNHTGASGGTITTYGLDIDVVGDATIVSNTAYGATINVSGATVATGLQIDVDAGTASKATGIYINSEDGGTDIKNVSSADVNDHFTIKTIEDGETTLETLENGGGSTAHLNMVVDGNFTVTAVGEIDFNASTCGFTAQTGTDAVSIDWTAGNKYHLLMENNSTVTFATNPTNPCNLLLKVAQGNGGSKIITWAVTSGDIYWAGGGKTDTDKPTLTTTDDDTDIISFYYDGSDYYGVASLNFDTA